MKTSRTLAVPLSDEVPTPSNKEVFGVAVGEYLVCGTVPGMTGEGLPASGREKQGCCSSGSPVASPTTDRWLEPPVPSRGLSISLSPRNSPSRYTQHKAPKKHRGAAGELGPAEGLMSPAGQLGSDGDRGLFMGHRKMRAAWEATRRSRRE